MNINNLVRDVKKSLGIGSFIKTQYTDYDIMKYIQDHTRNVLSRIYGHRVYYPMVRFGKENQYGATHATFKIPIVIMDELKFEETDIVGIRDLRVSPMFNDGMILNKNIMPPIGSNYQVGGNFGNALGSSVQDQYMGGMNSLVSIANARANIDLYRRPIKCRFTPPNLLQFNPDGLNPLSCNFELTIKTGHPKSMWTIPPSLYHVVLELAKLDIMEYLWNSELKGLEGLSNGYDNISLKIDDWANASERRKEYLDRLSEDIIPLEGIHPY